MSFIFHRLRSVLGTIAVLAFCVPVSRAAYVASIQEVGSDVVATGSGSFDTTDLTFLAGNSNQADISGSNGVLFLGPASLTADTVYDVAIGPSSFGSGVLQNANTGSGPIVGVSGFSNLVEVPSGYTSGTALATSTATWTGQTLTSLGLTPGTYTYTWGSDGDADSFTVNIIPAATGVPLPAGLWAALLAIPLAFIARKRMLCA